MFHLTGNRIDLAADAPVELLYLGAGVEVYDAVAEEVERLFANLLGVVPRLQHAALAQLVPDGIELLDQFVGILVGLPFVVHLGQRGRFEHLEDEHRVVSRQAASRLGDDVRMGESMLISCIDEGGDHVVDILLNGVVDRAFAVAGAGAIVVHTHAATGVDELDVEAHLMQLDIELRSLAQGVLDAAYLGNLTADVEVNQLQAILQVLLVEEVQGFEQLAGSEAELAGVSTALLPLATATGGQLDADANVGAHLQLTRHLSDDVQLVELLHHEVDALAHLLSQQSHLDEALVLVAVAHHERVGVGVDTDDGMQLRFGAGFETQVELLAMLDHLLHHGAHLIHLDRIDNEVLSLIAILLGRLLEAAGNLLDAVVQDVGEAQQHRRRNVAQLQFVHHVAQVNLYVVFAWRHVHVALVVYTEVRRAPTVDVVELA